MMADKCSHVGSNDSTTNCIQWINDVFGDCVDTNLKLAGFIVTAVSLLLWAMPLFPQLVHNYRHKRADGVSPYLILLWLFGDTCNLIGAVLTSALPMMARPAHSTMIVVIQHWRDSIQKIIAAYYIIQDTMLLVQIFYYGWASYSRETNIRGTALNAALGMGLLAHIFGGSAAGVGATPSEVSLGCIAPTFWGEVFTTPMEIVGFIFGTISAIAYITSRFPQMHLNYSRKSCKGVSLTMLLILVPADFTYNIGVLLQSTGWVYVMRKMPWTVGYALSGVLDTFTLYQYFHYGTGRAEKRIDITRF